MGGNFDLVAPVYDALAFLIFGRRLRRAQRVWLNQIPAGASVLIVGGGTGGLLEPVLQGKPGRVLYLEASSQMVSRASRRMIGKSLLGSVEFRVGNETALRADERFDVLITPFVLDLFTETTLQTRLIPPLLHALKPTGLWLVTDFVNTSVWWQRALLWSMIRFFRLTAGMEASQLADWQQCLTDAGLIREKRQPQVGGMVSAEIWSQIGVVVSGSQT